MSGHQYLKFCLSSGLINETTFSFDVALMVLKKVTKNVRAHAEHRHVHHHHSHHVHSQGGGDMSESESETDSYSSFDSEASAEELDDESDDEEKSSKKKEYDKEYFKNPDGSPLDLKTANVHASEYTLLFPHFIECVVRLILLRYQPVVSKAVVDAWVKEKDEFAKNFGDDRGSIDGRRYSRATRGDDKSASSIPGIPNARSVAPRMSMRRVSNFSSDR